MDLRISPHLTNKPSMSAVTSARIDLDSHLDRRSVHAMFGVVCFQEFGRDTGHCETQNVVLSIVHETQAQNYNVTFFVRSQYENKETKVSDSKTGVYTTLHSS